MENFSAFTIADFSGGDGVSDIAYASGNEVVVQFGVAGGSFLTSTETYTVPDDLIEQLAAGVLTASGKNDLVAANDTANGSSPAEVSVLINNGGGGFAPPVDYDAGTSAVAIALGDFDGDGSLDIVSRDAGVGVNFFANSGSGTFAPAAAVSMSTDTFGAWLADFNSDTKADLVVPQIDFSTGAGHGDAVTYYLEGATSSGGGGSTGGGGGSTSSLTGSRRASSLALGQCRAEGDDDLAECRAHQRRVHDAQRKSHREGLPRRRRDDRQQFDSADHDLKERQAEAACQAPAPLQCHQAGGIGAGWNVSHLRCYH